MRPVLARHDAAVGHTQALRRVGYSLFDPRVRRREGRGEEVDRRVGAAAGSRGARVAYRGEPAADGSVEPYRGLRVAPGIRTVAEPARQVRGGAQSCPQRSGGAEVRPPGLGLPVVCAAGRQPVRAERGRRGIGGGAGGGPQRFDVLFGGVICGDVPVPDRPGEPADGVELPGPPVEHRGSVGVVAGLPGAIGLLRAG
ncbi:MAG: hypothetical protein LC714_05145 [Actinobacteria bacterium]|nr:hypothetical protein [Actinomycetota bacterium]